MLINLTIDTEEKEIYISIPAQYKTPKFYAILNSYIVSYIKRKLLRFIREIEKLD